jgi:hypothetical protein
MAWAHETLASLRLALDSRVEESQFWTEEEARLALNEALECWNLLTGYWSQTVTVQVGPGTPIVGLPASILFRTRVTHAALPLAPSSLPDLFRGRPGWWNETTDAGGDTPTVPKVWAPVSLTMLAIWPQPATIQTLTVTGVAATPILLEDSDPVDLEDGVVDAITGYAQHALTFKEGWTRFASTQSLMKDFLDMAGEENAQLNASAAYRQYLGNDRRRGLRPTLDAPERLGGVVGGGNMTAGAPQG